MKQRSYRVRNNGRALIIAAAALCCLFIAAVGSVLVVGDDQPLEQIAEPARDLQRSTTARPPATTKSTSASAEVIERPIERIKVEPIHIRVKLARGAKTRHTTSEPAGKAGRGDRHKGGTARGPAVGKLLSSVTSKLGVEASEGAAVDDHVAASPTLAGDRQEPRATRLDGRLVRDSELRRRERHSAASFERCYRETSVSATQTPDKAHVELALDDAGRVANVRLDPATPGLSGCISRVVRAWKFPDGVRRQRLSFSIVHIGASVRGGS